MIIWDESTFHNMFSIQKMELFLWINAMLLQTFLYILEPEFDFNTEILVSQYLSGSETFHLILYWTKLFWNQRKHQSFNQIWLETCSNY